jgi:hypothetical protein
MLQCNNYFFQNSVTYVCIVHQRHEGLIQSALPRSLTSSCARTGSPKDFATNDRFNGFLVYSA